MTDVTIEQRERVNKWLDELANMVEFFENLEMTSPESLPGGYIGQHIYRLCWDMEEFSKIVGSLGSCEKYSDETSIGVKKRFGPHVFDVYIPKTVSCERKVVGFEYVEERIIPAHEREIVEWVCPESFLAPSEDAL